jgi:hypothetical protein
MRKIQENEQWKKGEKEEEKGNKECDMKNHDTTHESRTAWFAQMNDHSFDIMTVYKEDIAELFTCIHKKLIVIKVSKNNIWRRRGFRGPI